MRMCLVSFFMFENGTYFCFEFEMPKSLCIIGPFGLAYKLFVEREKRRLLAWKLDVEGCFLVWESVVSYTVSSEA